MRWVLLLLPLAVLACRSEGERLVDRFAAQLTQASTTLSSGEGTPEECAIRTLRSLEQEAVQMRILQSRLDDVVRTLSERQRRKLADYARAKLAEAAGGGGGGGGGGGAERQ